MRLFYTVFIFLLCTISCNQQIEIAGHWRPADSFQSRLNSNGDIPQFRDLILKRDSTFIAVGYDQQPTQTDGWHNSDTKKGKWNYSNGILSLRIEDVSRPLKFTVRKLTSQEMIMENEFMKSIELRFTRLKN